MNSCCCLSPSHLLNQCWLILSMVLHHPPKASIPGSAYESNYQNACEKYIFKLFFFFKSHAPGAYELSYPILFLLIRQHHWSHMKIMRNLAALQMLTHWGRVTHICISKLAIIGSDNGLLPERHQAIIWTNAGRVLIRPLGTNVNEILFEIHMFSFKKLHFKMSSAKWHPLCLGLNMLWLIWLIG